MKSYEVRVSWKLTKGCLVITAGAFILLFVHPALINPLFFIGLLAFCVTVFIRRYCYPRYLLVTDKYIQLPSRMFKESRVIPDTSIAGNRVAKVGSWGETILFLRLKGGGEVRISSDKVDDHAGLIEHISRKFDELDASAELSNRDRRRIQIYFLGSAAMNGVFFFVTHDEQMKFTFGACGAASFLISCLFLRFK